MNGLRVGPRQAATAVDTATAADLGLLLLRLGPAVIFTVHGYLKLLGGQFDRTVALFMTVNIPAPEFSVWVVSVIEFLGGLLLALGLGTRLVAGLLAVEMAVALLRVRWPQGFVGAGEFEFLLLLVCLALTATGSGKVSLDTVVRARRRTGGA
ncbi:MAG: DoxX family protein [Armatimonadetes bacterium]|nr:DoxX family protein [Armatimonadota bacterium]